MNVCIVCDRGWIIKGKILERNRKDLILKEASVVRTWHNGKGIGGIAKESNKDEYTLDYIGDVSIKQDKIIFTIPCEW